MMVEVIMVSDGACFDERFLQWRLWSITIWLLWLDRIRLNFNFQHTQSMFLDRIHLTGSLGDRSLIGGIVLLIYPDTLPPPTSYILHPTSYILHLTSYILHITFYILHFTFYILHLTSYILHLTYYILHQMIFSCNVRPYIEAKAASLYQGCAGRSGVGWSGVGRDKGENPRAGRGKKARK